MKKILEVVVGSTVHGTSVDDGLEDLDLMSVMLEDQQTFCGFGPQDTWTKRTKPQGVRSEAGDIDWVGYGLRKYLHLALKGNPTILLALFVPDHHVREITPEGTMLRSLAPLIASKQAYEPFRGYMRQQIERMEGTRGQRNVTRPELVEKYGYDTKFAGHAVRLGLQGKELLRTGRLSLPMRDDERALVVKIRTGGYTLEQVLEMAKLLEIQLDREHAESPLPDKPDVAGIERWMLEIYLAHWSKA